MPNLEGAWSWMQGLNKRSVEIGTRDIAVPNVKVIQPFPLPSIIAAANAIQLTLVCSLSDNLHTSSALILPFSSPLHVNFGGFEK